MANWRWECQTCQKAKAFPGSGICFACSDDKCEYEPFQNFATTSTEYNPTKIAYQTSNTTELKGEKKMKSIEELRLTAKAVRERARIQREKALERAIRENIEYLEKAIAEAAEDGQYEAMSDNLCDPRYRKGSSYSQKEMENLMRNALIKHFTALGFLCKGQLSNYLTISWAEEKK